MDAQVTVATAEDPYQPVSRFTDLIETTGNLQFVNFDVAVLEPIRSTLCERIVDGMTTELIAPPRVIRYIRSTYPAEFEQPLESGNLTVRIHHDLPSYGVGVFDDRVAIACYDSDGVTVRVVVDSTGERALDWAESVYQRHVRQTPTLAI